MNLRQMLKEALTEAQKVIGHAIDEGRDVTKEEATRLEELVTEAEGYKAQLDQIAQRGDLEAKFKALGEEVIPGPGAEFDTAGPAAYFAGGPLGKGRHASFAQLAPAAARAMRDISVRAGGYGIKGLVPSGETVLNVPLVNSIPIPADGSLAKPRRLVDMVPVVPREAPIYSFLKQIPATDPGGAAVVAPGAEKPVKKLGVQRVDSRLRVVAVLSEPIDKYLLEDAASLQTWVGAELVDAIEAELETQIISGDSAGENFTGISNTSGIQAQSFITDALVTTKYALSKLQVLNLEPEFIAMSSADLLDVQTFRDANGRFFDGGPVDVSASTLWGVPIVGIPGLSTGTAYAIAKDSLQLSTDGKLRLEWNSATGFTRNEVQGRVEGRFNLDVLRPYGIVEIDLNETP